MSLLAAERIERRPSRRGAVRGERRASVVDRVVRERDECLGGGLTLDDAIVGVWEGLAAQVVVACPACGGPLRPHAAPDVVGGRCGDCGTTLD